MLTLFEKISNAFLFGNLALAFGLVSFNRVEHKPLDNRFYIRNDGIVESEYIQWRFDEIQFASVYSSEALIQSLVFEYDGYVLYQPSTDDFLFDCNYLYFNFNIEYLNFSSNGGSYSNLDADFTSNTYELMSTDFYDFTYYFNYSLNGASSTYGYDLVLTTGINQYLSVQNETVTLPTTLNYNFHSSYSLSLWFDLLFNELRESYNYYISYGQNQYQLGYTQGYNDASLEGGVASEIFTGILNVGLLPVNFFLAIFNFEIFGVNLASIVAALISVAITIIVIKVCTGKGGGSDD